MSVLNSVGTLVESKEQRLLVSLVVVELERARISEISIVNSVGD